MYQSLLKKARIEEKKAQAKRQIQEKALAEAEALKAKIASNIQKQKQETGDDIAPSIDLKESTTINPPEKIIEANKTKHYKECTVKQHQRKIYEREYKFVCSGCDKIVERSSYALCCPTYGMECSGKKSKCKRFTKSIPRN